MFLFQRLNALSRLTGLEPLPVGEQLVVVDLGPGLDKALLRAGQLASDQLDDIHRHHADAVLIIGMEVRAVMRR